jgi:hypothetical protein
MLGGSFPPLVLGPRKKQAGVMRSDVPVIGASTIHRQAWAPFRRRNLCGSLIFDVAFAQISVSSLLLVNTRVKILLHVFLMTRSAALDWKIVGHGDEFGWC